MFSKGTYNKQKLVDICFQQTFSEMKNSKTAEHDFFEKSCIIFMLFVSFSFAFTFDFSVV